MVLFKCQFRSISSDYTATFFGGRLALYHNNQAQGHPDQFEADNWLLQQLLHPTCSSWLPSHLDRREISSIKDVKHFSLQIGASRVNGKTLKSPLIIYLHLLLLKVLQML